MLKNYQIIAENGKRLLSSLLNFLATLYSLLQRVCLWVKLGA